MALGTRACRRLSAGVPGLLVRTSACQRDNALVAYHQRRLPHLDAVGQPLFVTFRLHGSLPAHRAFPPDGLMSSGTAFAAMDRLLDGADAGPLALRRPEIAALVTAALRRGEQRLHYQLHSYVVMPNHVHLLVTPLVATARWLGPLKGFTAREANRILGLTGSPFWQDESYDQFSYCTSRCGCLAWS